MNNKKSYIIGGLVGFVILIGIAFVVLGGAMKKEKLLVVPETATMAKITKDGNAKDVIGDELQNLRDTFVNLGVREFSSEGPERDEGVLIEFYENDTKCAKFRIIDKGTLWDFVKYEKTGLIVVYKTDVDLLELVSKY